MRFLADMNVSRSIVQHLRAAGHDVLHVRDVSARSAPEEQIFGLARADRRILLTFDLDVGQSTGRGSPAILALRLNDARPAHAIDRLAVILDQASGALETGAIVVVDDESVRSRIVTETGR